MSTIGLHWSGFGLLSLLAAALPGLLAGLWLGARAWPAQRGAGAALGGAFGALASVGLLALYFSIRIPMGV